MKGSHHKDQFSYYKKNLMIFKPGIPEYLHVKFMGNIFQFINFIGQFINKIINLIAISIRVKATILLHVITNDIQARHS